MALDYRVDNLDSIDENLRSLYAEKTDGDKKYYTLDVNGVKSEDEFNTVYKTLQTERNSRKDFESKYKAFGDNTPESISALKTELESYKTAKSSATEEDFLKRLNDQKQASYKELESLKSSFNTKETDYQNQLKARDTELLNMRLENELSKRYLKKGDPSGFKLALSVAKDELEWDADHKEFRTKDGLGRMDDWLETDLFKNYQCLLKGSFSGGARNSDSTGVSYEKYFDRSNKDYNSDEFLAKRSEFFRKDAEKARAFINKYK